MTEQPDVRRLYSAEELLGPLNPQEQLYAPKQLFAAGHVEWLRQERRVSVVGARKASPYGLKRAARLARLLVKHGAIVVSGLEEGIDAAAHTATVDAGGRTVAVIGTPLSETFPAKHRGLQQLLMREHLVVSQFPEGQPTTRKNFPLRNRTMAVDDPLAIFGYHDLVRVVAHLRDARDRRRCQARDERHPQDQDGSRRCRDRHSSRLACSLSRVVTLVAFTKRDSRDRRGSEARKAAG
jgi:hypothetical protein